MEETLNKKRKLAWLCYPFNDIIGSINSGLLNLSRYQIEESMRRSYPVSDSFPDKFFDLDRCFSVNRVPTIDGFIVSDNVEVIFVYNSKVSNGKGEMFSYSDHQPATSTFRLS